MLGELLGKQKESAALPDVQEQSQCSVAGVELKEGQTSPPKHFTDVIFCERKEWIGIEERSSAREEKKIKAMALLLCMKDCLVMMIMLERVTV